MKIFVSTFLLIVVLLFSCKNRSASKNKDNNISKTRDTIIKPSRDSVIKFPSVKSALKVSAYLIYDDGTLSTFDVLNDKTLALWNVVAGGGDALKPSNNTKVNLSGNLDNLRIKIKNGHKLIIDTTIIHSDKDIEYVIKNTGCSEVYVDVIRNRMNLYNDTIPFHCGE